MADSKIDIEVRTPEQFTPEDNQRLKKAIEDMFTAKPLPGAAGTPIDIADVNTITKNK